MKEREKEQKEQKEQKNRRTEEQKEQKDAGGLYIGVAANAERRLTWFMPSVPAVGPLWSVVAHWVVQWVQCVKLWACRGEVVGPSRWRNRPMRYRCCKLLAPTALSNRNHHSALPISIPYLPFLLLLPYPFPPSSLLLFPSLLQFYFYPIRCRSFPFCILCAHLVSGRNHLSQVWPLLLWLWFLHST